MEGLLDLLPNFVYYKINNWLKVKIEISNNIFPLIKVEEVNLKVDILVNWFCSLNMSQINLVIKNKKNN